VVDRKLGIPISLALVQMEVTRRLGLPLQGVSFPGHFLVRLPVDDGILVLDPFNKGRPVSAEELRTRALPHLGGQAPDAGLLLKLAPDMADAWRDRGLAYLELGHVRGAREDLGRYLQMQPEAEDADAVRDALVVLAGQPARLN